MANEQSRSPLRHLLNRSQQRRKIERPVVTHAINEKTWRAVHSAPHSAAKILAHSLEVGTRLHLLDESRYVEMKRARVPHQVFIFQRVLILVEQVVHLPELALSAGSLRRLSGMLGMRMRLREREIPKNKPHLVAEALLQRLHHRRRFVAVGTFVVPVFDQRDRRLRRSLHVIVRADRRFEFGSRSRTHRAASYFFDVSASSASSIPSAPGFTPSGDR